MPTSSGLPLKASFFHKAQGFKPELTLVPPPDLSLSHILKILLSVDSSLGSSLVLFCPVFVFTADATADAATAAEVQLDRPIRLLLFVILALYGDSISIVWGAA